MDYFKMNKAYWEKGYNAVNVDHMVFRFYGRILKPDFGITGQYEPLLDFGCGQGAAVNFFAKQGFNARGVDISETDIGVAKIRYPHIADSFIVCDPDPRNNECYGFGEDIAVVTAIQSLYYFTDTDFNLCIEKIYAAMRPGAVIFATMMGEKSRMFFENSEEVGDGLRMVNFKNERIQINNYCISFIKDEAHLERKFKMFKPVHMGYYAAKYRTGEGDSFHYTFCGVKE